MTGGTGNGLFVFAAGFGNDVINGFDADLTGGRQNLLDVTAYRLDPDNFAATVSVRAVRVPLDRPHRRHTITLTGINGIGANAVTIDDFELA